MPANVLAISGSLRTGSSNARLLDRMQIVAGPDCVVTQFDGLAGLPAFNPDQDAEPPAEVIALRATVGAAEGVIISSPEYAHGVVGALKNALDWLVGSGELYGKSVLLINASARAFHAQAALAETLRTMGARIIGDVRVAPPASEDDPSADGALIDALALFALGEVVAAAPVTPATSLLDGTSSHGE